MAYDDAASLTLLRIGILLEDDDGVGLVLSFTCEGIPLNERIPRCASDESPCGSLARFRARPESRTVGT